METVNDLVKLYQRAVEYYNGTNDSKYMQWENRLQSLFLKPEILMMLQGKQTEAQKLAVDRDENSHESQRERQKIVQSQFRKQMKRNQTEIDIDAIQMENEKVLQYQANLKNEQAKEQKRQDEVKEFLKQQEKNESEAKQTVASDIMEQSKALKQKLAQRRKTMLNSSRPFTTKSQSQKKLGARFNFADQNFGDENNNNKEAINRTPLEEEGQNALNSQSAVVEDLNDISYIGGMNQSALLDESLNFALFTTVQEESPRKKNAFENNMISGFKGAAADTGCKLRVNVLDPEKQTVKKEYTPMKRPLVSQLDQIQDCYSDEESEAKPFESMFAEESFHQQLTDIMEDQDQKIEVLQTQQQSEIEELVENNVTQKLENLSEIKAEYDFKIKLCKGEKNAEKREKLGNEKTKALEKCREQNDQQKKTKIEEIKHKYQKLKDQIKVDKRSRIEESRDTLTKTNRSILLRGDSSNSASPLLNQPKTTMGRQSKPFLADLQEQLQEEDEESIQQNEKKRTIFPIEESSDDSASSGMHDNDSAKSITDVDVPVNMDNIMISKTTTAVVNKSDSVEKGFEGSTLMTEDESSNLNIS